MGDVETVREFCSKTSHKHTGSLLVLLEAFPLSWPTGLDHVVVGHAKRGFAKMTLFAAALVLFLAIRKYTPTLDHPLFYIPAFLGGLWFLWALSDALSVFVGILFRHTCILDSCTLGWNYSYPRMIMGLLVLLFLIITQHLYMFHICKRK